MVIAYVSVQWNPSLVVTLSVEMSPEYPHPRKEKTLPWHRGHSGTSTQSWESSAVLVGSQNV